MDTVPLPIDQPFIPLQPPIRLFRLLSLTAAGLCLISSQLTARTSAAPPLLAAEVEQPEAGREAFYASCTACHGASRALSAHKTLDEWHSTVDRMANKPGANIPAQSRAAIASFLAARPSPDEEPEGAPLTLQSLAESLELHGSFSALYNDSGRDDHLENPGFVPEIWLEASWHNPTSVFSAKVSACTTCHLSSESEGRSIELVEASLRLDINRVLGMESAPLQAALEAGRLRVPFGAFSAQSNPAAYRTVTRPLLYSMGQLVDRSQMGPAVLPMPYVDEGLQVNLSAPLPGNLKLNLDLYAINGLQGTLGVDFFASRAYTDNNGDPAFGGRLSIGHPSFTVGISAMTGNLESASGGILGRLGYELFGIDLNLRIGRRLRLVGEFARRRNDQVTFISSAPRGDADVKGVVIEASYLLLEDQGISLVSRFDNLHYQASIAPLGSTLSSDFRTQRFTWGFDLGLPGGSNLMLNHEHWSMPEDLESVDLVGLRWVLSF